MRGQQENDWRPKLTVAGPGCRPVHLFAMWDSDEDYEIGEVQVTRVRRAAVSPQFGMAMVQLQIGSVLNFAYSVWESRG